MTALVMKVVEILIFCPYEFHLSLKKVHHFSLTSEIQKGRRFTVPIIMLNIRKTKSPCVQTKNLKRLITPEVLKYWDT